MRSPASSPRYSDRVEAVLGSGRPTPFLVIDLDVVAARFRELRHALPGAAIHYAVKANPHPEVLRLLVDLGCSFDVASAGEVDACLAAGAVAADLSFGNTVKRQADVAAAHGLGVHHFAVDAPRELAKVLDAAPGAAITVRLLCEGDGAAWPLSRKFGCDATSAVDLLVGAAEGGAADLGLAFHVGSQQRRPDAWDDALAEVAGVVDAASRRGAEVGIVNIGGGFPATYDEAVAPTDVYGKAIRDALDRHLGDRDLTLVVEPGRFLVADAGVLQSEVLLVADRPGATADRWVYLDAGVYTGLVEALGEAIRYPIRTRHDGPVVPCVIAGPTCDSLDVLYEVEPVELPVALAEGDRVSFDVVAGPKGPAAENVRKL